MQIESTRMRVSCQGDKAMRDFAKRACKNNAFSTTRSQIISLRTDGRTDGLHSAARIASPPAVRRPPGFSGKCAVDCRFCYIPDPPPVSGPETLRTDALHSAARIASPHAVRRPPLVAVDHGTPCQSSPIIKNLCSAGFPFEDARHGTRFLTLM